MGLLPGGHTAMSPGLSEGFGEVCPTLQGPPQGGVQDWIVGRGGDSSGAGAWPGQASRRIRKG